MERFCANRTNFRFALKAAGQIAPGPPFHGLRHTLATKLREEGFDDRTIADALGQETEAMTRHYAQGANP